MLVNKDSHRWFYVHGFDSVWLKMVVMHEEVVLAAGTSVYCVGTRH